MKLYYSTGACSLSPRIVAAELGLPLEAIKTDLRKKTLENGEDFLKINPKGQVPTLELDNGELLTEGVAIVQYLASLVPGNTMMPEGFARFKQLELLNFITSELHKTFSWLFDPTATDEFKQKIHERLATRFSYLEGALTKNTYLMGETFTCADAYLFNILSWADYVKVSLPPFLKDYTARVARRPAVVAAMKAEGLIKG